MHIFIKMYFLFWLVIFSIAFIREFKKYITFKFRMHKIRKSNIISIDRMEGHQFELYLCSLFEKYNYKVYWVGEHGNDFGCDLVIEKKGIRVAVQAKRYSNLVGIEAVQQVVASKAYYNCVASYVVTNNYFTKQAQKLANVNLTELIDRDRLINLINKKV